MTKAVVDLPLESATAEFRADGEKLRIINHSQFPATALIRDWSTGDLIADTGYTAPGTTDEKDLSLAEGRDVWQLLGIQHVPGPANCSSPELTS